MSPTSWLKLLEHTGALKRSPQVMDLEGRDPEAKPLLGSGSSQDLKP